MGRCAAVVPRARIRPWMHNGWMSAIAGLALLALAPHARAHDVEWGHIDRLATGRLVTAPGGWLNFCMAHLAACRPTAEVRQVELTPERFAMIRRVHREVNQAIKPATEPAGRDLWQIAPSAGDCDDYALTKQALLRAAGLPSGAVRLATVRLADGQHHALVTVETDRGTLVLDNLEPDVVPFAATRYRWMRLEEPGAAFSWLELQGEPIRDAKRSLPARAGRALPDRVQTGQVAQ